jgi:hypothetical protein
MSNPSLGFFELHFLCSFELSGPFDEHQEIKAPGVPPGASS